MLVSQIGSNRGNLVRVKSGKGREPVPGDNIDCQQCLEIFRGVRLCCLLPLCCLLFHGAPRRVWAPPRALLGCIGACDSQAPTTDGVIGAPLASMLPATTGVAWCELELVSGDGHVSGRGHRGCVHARDAHGQRRVARRSIELCALPPTHDIAHYRFGVLLSPGSSVRLVRSTDNR